MVVLGCARLRTTQRDGMEWLRRFLQHVLPEGVVNVRPFGLLPARCAVPLATIRLLMGQGHPREDQPPRPPPPRVGDCPTGGVPMPVVMRVWTSPKAFADTR